MPERTMLKGELLLIMRIYGRIHGYLGYAIVLIGSLSTKSVVRLLLRANYLTQITQASHQKNVINRLLAFQVVHLFLA